MFRLWRLEFHAFKTLKWKCGFLLSILFASSLPVFRPSFLLYPNFRDRGLNSNKQQLYRQDFHIDMNPWNGLGTGILLKLAWSNDCFRRHSDWQWLAARTKICLHPKVGQDRRTTHHNGMLQRNQDSQQLSHNWPCTMWAGWCVFLPELSAAAVSARAAMALGGESVQPLALTCHAWLQPRWRPDPKSWHVLRVSQNANSHRPTP